MIPDLYSATVPVFRHYLPRILTIAGRPGADLTGRLAEGSFTAGEHLVVAQGFALRTVFPVLGRMVPETSTEAPTVGGLQGRHVEVMRHLGSLTTDDFTATEVRQITHRAGEGEVSQGVEDYVLLFGLPNFFFHLSLGYAILRGQGVEVGKADFDGLHSYPPGFRFDD